MFHTAHMLEYGTNIVGGVTPGKGGQVVGGVPINLIKEVEIPKQVTGYEYEVLACAKAIDKNELECEAMPHKETIFVMEILDKIRNQWNMKYPFEK